MIEIINGKFDSKYFEKMSFNQFKNYMLDFSSYEDFLKKEKIPFIPKDTFENWYYTISFMDINPSNIKSIIHRFITTSVTIDGVKYKEGTIKEIIKNYQKYKENEYLRIYEEFRNLANNF